MDTSSKNILRDDAVQSILISEGYAVVPFLNPQEVKDLTAFFFQHHPQLPEGMYASSHATDFDFRKRMNDEVKRACARAVDATFKNAAPLGATFMVKSKGENGSLHPHQDWSIVDETKFNSYNIWLPLVDVNEENGTLLILPGSHTMLKNTRGLNIPSSFAEVEKEAWQYLVPVSLKAGEALIYDHRLLHASGVNKTPVPRLVVVYGIIPEAADMRYYYGNGNQIEEYACTADFYFNEKIGEGPGSLTKISSKSNSNAILSLADFEKEYGRPKTIWKRLMDAFA